MQACIHLHTFGPSNKIYLQTLTHTHTYTHTCIYTYRAAQEELESANDEVKQCWEALLEAQKRANAAEKTFVTTKLQVHIYIYVCVCMYVFMYLCIYDSVWLCISKS